MDDAASHGVTSSTRYWRCRTLAILPMSLVVIGLSRIAYLADKLTGDRV